MREEHPIVTGIHRCTICVGAAQEDIDFMTKVIGQRLIKQTVLFDGTALGSTIPVLCRSNRSGSIAWGAAGAVAAPVLPNFSRRPPLGLRSPRWPNRALHGSC